MRDLPRIVERIRRTDGRKHTSDLLPWSRVLAWIGLLAWIGVSAPDAAAQVWLGIGYDGVSQEYFLTTIDTFLISGDSVAELKRTATAINEGQVSLRTRLGRDVFWDQTTALTSLYWHHRSSVAAITPRLKPTWAGLEYRLNLKTPHTDKEANAFSNFVVHELRGDVQHRRGSVILRLRGVEELVKYPQPGTLTYDYRRFRGEFRISRGSDALRYQEASLMFIRRDVPDSSRISYNEAGVNLGAGFTIGRWRAGVTAEFYDRRYDATDAGLDFGTFRFRGNWNDDGITALWPGLLEIESYQYYDRAALLADFARVDLRQRRAFPLAHGWTPYVEPGAEAVWSAADEDYFEPRLVVGTETFTMQGWWLSGDLNVGHRTYPYGSAAGFTDFWRLDLNLLLDAPLWRRVNLNIVYSQEWEWHSQLADDISVFLLSAGLRYRL